MFKVSLLPESYRKQLIGKKNRQIILSVSVIVLVCMLVIYAGIAIRLLILQGQEKKVDAYSAKINQRIEELSPYVDDYNALAIAQAKVALIKPVDITALEFISEVQSITPDYIRISTIACPEWQSKQICVIEGDLSSANDLRSANSMLLAYADVLKGDELFGESIKELKIVNDMPIINEGEDGNTYSFRIIVSLSGAISIDESGMLLTTTTTEVSTEATTEETTVAESTEATSIEPSTIGTGAPTEAPSESTSETPSESTTGGTSNE